MQRSPCRPFQGCWRADAAGSIASTHTELLCRFSQAGHRSKHLEDVFGMRTAHHELYSPCMWLAQSSEIGLELCFAVVTSQQMWLAL